ncbi:PspC domain-containing protein [Telmatospirillum sp. J64-1]|uniref:PspC domain-containing protein n=1 Tax=Telmatospirillum sp. J64-1 TaxID=2502183 RepID=UPI00115E1577|nr:PspC domain-containing protein [Telmatospirillum sp. J64-1]
MTSDLRFRLYRRPEDGWVAGVCAGLAEYLGIDVRLARLGWFLGLVFFTLPSLLAYLALAAFLRRRPPEGFGSPREEALRRAVHLGPQAALREAKGKLQDTEERLKRLEEAVLSEDFQLRRKFRDL